MNEIEYGRSYEYIKVKEKVVSRNIKMNKIFGNITPSMIFISFILLVPAIATQNILFIIPLAISMFVGIIYEFYGGYDAERGYRFVNHRRDYVDFLETKTGKIRRVYIAEAQTK